MKNVAVIGSGSWGTALAIILTKYDHQVKIWARSQAAVDEINSKHTNEKYLPGVTLPETLTATTDRTALWRVRKSSFPLCLPVRCARP